MQVEFEDEDVQVVYNILCSSDTPPKGFHWEGFVAEKIVNKLRELYLAKFKEALEAKIEQ